MERTILVTGANKGIGLAIVRRLLADFPDTHLLLGSRDVTRGQAAVQQLVGDLGENIKTRLDLVQLDVCSDKSVTAAMQTIKTKLREGESLYGVVNNAGGILADPRQTIDLNTYGPVRVYQAAVPLLQQIKGGDSWHNCSV